MIKHIAKLDVLAVPEMLKNYLQIQWIFFCFNGQLNWDQECMQILLDEGCL
jgi:hypothetical protein